MYPQLFWPIRNQFQRWSMGFRELGVPVIAAIHGNCFGAGLQLALGADMRISTPDARLSVLESKWGLVPDMGGPTLLRELVRVDVAKELTFTGRVLSGEQALRLGLVSHLDSDPLARARLLAEEISARSPDAVAAGKFLHAGGVRRGRRAGARGRAPLATTRCLACATSAWPSPATANRPTNHTFRAASEPERDELDCISAPAATSRPRLHHACATA